MGYVETLFGHQDHVLSLDALRGETCVSVGGRDKTVRYWKIVEESQLVFRGGGRSRVREVLEGGLRGDDEGDDVDDPMDGDVNPKSKEKESTRKCIEGSIECVAMIDETTFVSGGDSGWAPFSPLYSPSPYLTFLPAQYVYGQPKRKSQYLHNRFHMALTKSFLRLKELSRRLAG
jgi:hypothetical protein